MEDLTNWSDGSNQKVWNVVDCILNVQIMFLNQNINVFLYIHASVDTPMIISKKYGMLKLRITGTSEMWDSPAANT